MANVRESPSVSDPVRVKERGVSSAAVTDWASPTGASLIDVTVIDTVAGAESRVPSFAVNVKLSAPKESADGV